MLTDRIAALVRSIDVVASRRVSLAAFAAGLATSRGLFGSDDVTARKKRRKKKKKCKGGTTNCGKTCVDLASDGANCGACGHACSLDLCFHGACVCITSDDCADGCVCKPSVQGAFVCASDATEDLCVTDDDCPLGSFCLNIINQPRTCTVPCLG